VDELMTGMLVAGSKPLLSRITIGSLADLGYQVDYSKADSYTKANLGPGCTCRRRRTERSLAEMDHGDTVQLGLHSRPGVQQRRLSDNLRQSAIEYGQTVLASRALGVNRKLANADDAVYVGDQIVSVLVRDGDNIHGVIVKRIV
jgi:hypothetical protein